MSDIKLSCPHCKQHIEAPEDMGGQVVECPTCQKQMTVPNPGAQAAVQKSVSVSPPATPSNASPLAKVSALWRSGAKGKAIIVGSAVAILVIIGALSDKGDKTTGTRSASDDSGNVEPATTSGATAPDAQLPAFKDEEPAIKKEIAATTADAPVRQVKEHKLDFPDAPFTIGKENEPWQRVMKEVRTALDSGVPNDLKEAIRQLEDEFKQRYYNDDQGRMQQHDAVGLQNKQKVYGAVIDFLKPISEKWEIEQKQLKALEQRAREADRDADKMLVLVAEFKTALEATSCPYKKSDVHYFLSNETFPFWQFPWMIRIKANGLKKEQWANDSERQQIEATYAKFKGQRPAREDFKDVIFNPPKYKGKVIISRVHMTGPVPAFYPILTPDSTMGLDCPKEVWDKLRRAHSAVGDHGVAKIKYWCNGSENNMSRGVLLDIEI